MSMSREMINQEVAKDSFNLLSVFAINCACFACCAGLARWVPARFNNNNTWLLNSTGNINNNNFNNNNRACGVANLMNRFRWSGINGKVGRSVLGVLQGPR